MEYWEEERGRKLGVRERVDAGGMWVWERIEGDNGVMECVKDL